MEGFLEKSFALKGAGKWFLGVPENCKDVEISSLNLINHSIWAMLEELYLIWFNWMYKWETLSCQLLIDLAGQIGIVRKLGIVLIIYLWNGIVYCMVINSWTLFLLTPISLIALNIRWLSCFYHARYMIIGLIIYMRRSRGWRQGVQTPPPPPPPWKSQVAIGFLRNTGMDTLL